MKFIEPKIFHLAGTKLNLEGVNSYLQQATLNKHWDTDTDNDGEVLIEIAGKTCYRSFSEHDNPNLKKVRDKENAKYLKNIIKSRHGSVLEHVYDTFALVGVSRVLTHEMVRHRLANYSQESLRFVRLQELSAYYPSAFQQNRLQENEIQVTELQLKLKMQECFEYLENLQLDLANLLDLQGMESFNAKKEMTSALRRMAPIGLTTTLIMTANARSWRHIITQRTNRHAEEEIRKVTAQIYEHLSRENPNIYQDAEITVVNGIKEIVLQSA